MTTSAEGPGQTGGDRQPRERRISRRRDVSDPRVRENLILLGRVATVALVTASCGVFAGGIVAIIHIITAPPGPLA